MNPAGAVYQSPPSSFAMPLPYAPPAGSSGTTATLMPLQRAPAPAPVPRQPEALPPSAVPVYEVWAENFDEMQITIGYFAAHARCVAVNVHYPGVVHGARQDLGALTVEQRYAILKANVDALKPIQVGLAICTEGGSIAAWELNLCDSDEAVGVPMAKLIRVLRVTCRPGVELATHAGAYHVAYLMKVISGGKQLPSDIDGFFRAVRRSLGDDVYDVALMAAEYRDLPVGLAGAGSVQTILVYMGLWSHPHRGNLDRFRCVLQGLQAV
ncbi:hypothetical protein BS78_01G281900 [Paspalum vaginatum]|nr:hypothetical protein BS78_01G281900 [Paspalum vaginatum]